MRLTKANGQTCPPRSPTGGRRRVLAQHDGDYSAPRYFYIHDRLGSVRQVIDSSGDVVKYYTFEPFGETLKEQGTLSNPFMFTGQYFDSEIDEYYMRARQYYPHISRFTSRDPVAGQFKEPLTLHKYLYCINDPVNRNDPAGEFAWLIGLSGSANVNLHPFLGGVGGTYGRSMFIGIGEEGIFWGVLEFYAWGYAGGPGFGGASLTIDVAVSNVERPEEFEGQYKEFGGSAWTPYGVFGGSFAYSPSGTWIATPFSWGIGTPGFEFHAYGGLTVNLVEYEYAL